MAFLKRPAVVGSLLPLLLACGGAPKEAPKTVAAPPPAPTQVAPPEPDLTPVTAPAELVALGRCARPASFLTTVAGWVAVPFEPKMIDVLEPGLSETLALDAPIEFAVALPSRAKAPEEPIAVVSIGVTSVDKAKSLLEGYNHSALEETSPGVWLSAEGAKASCAVARSLGKTTSRLVCGSDADGLAQLLPYATRGLPLEDLGISDVGAEIRVEPLQKRYGAAARMGQIALGPGILAAFGLGDPLFDRPLADAARAIGADLIEGFEDLERIRFDLSAKSNPEQLEAKFSVAYRSHQSLFASTVASAKERMAPPNPMFFDLPANVTHAAYVSSMDPNLTEKSRVLTEGVVDGFLAHTKVAETLRKELTKSLDGVLAQGEARVFGHVPVEPPVGKSALSDAERISTTLGQIVIGIDGPSAKGVAWLKAFAKVYNDRTFRKGVEQIVSDRLNAASREEGGVERRDSGARAKSGAKKPKPAPLAKSPLELVKVKEKSIKGLPAGSEVLSISTLTRDTEQFIADTQKQLHRRGKLPKFEVSTVTVLVAVVPDGGRTWVILGADEAALATLAQSLLAGSATAKLGGRSEVSALRGQSAFSAGFGTLESFKGPLSLLLAQTRKKSGADASVLYSTLPHQGKTPVYYQFLATGDAAHPTFEGKVTLPRAMFDDIAAAVPTMMMSF